MPIATPTALAGERRLFDRYPCPHAAQSFFEEQWRDCAVLDISVGGALIKADCRPEVGEIVTLFVEDVAELPGAVVRVEADGFALRFESSFAAGA